MSDDVDPLLSGRAGLSYVELDACAHRLHRLLTAVAERQIDAPLLHEFTIDVATDASSTLTPPPGFRRPATGAVTTTLDVASRSVPTARIHVRVTVWPALGGADVVDLLVERHDTDHRLEVRVDEIHPETSDALRRRVNDYVARQVALVVSDLNVAMQRGISPRGWPRGDG